jgi:UDP-N-acetylglucosamine--N-acetylmuramyl-(pentapeptide) pyrophosphoryl-undecaprenol N-acetylglucosamine transferase
LSIGAFGARLPSAVARARRLIKRFDADVVVGAAGYVCVPVVLAARSLRLPVVLLEQNAQPGRAVRMLAGSAKVIATSFAVTSDYLNGSRVEYTGNPVRADVLRLRGHPTNDTPRNLLITGGSQGARTLNRATVGCIQQLLLDHPQLVVNHVTGTGDFNDVAIAADGITDPDLRSRYRILDFSDRLHELIAAADLVVMRAGGSSLAECSVIGRPMIVVPYPHAGDHQRHNAQPYVDAGAAISVADSEWNSARALKEISSLLGDTERWRAMTTASRNAGKPDATVDVVSLISEVAG